MRIIKFFAWESSILAKLTKLRQDEVHHLRKVKYWAALGLFFWNVNPTLVSVCPPHLRQQRIIIIFQQIGTFLVYITLHSNPGPAEVSTIIK